MANILEDLGIAQKRIKNRQSKKEERLLEEIARRYIAGSSRSEVKSWARLNYGKEAEPLVDSVYQRLDNSIRPVSLRKRIAEVVTADSGKYPQDLLREDNEQSFSDSSLKYLAQHGGEEEIDNLFKEIGGEEGAKLHSRYLNSERKGAISPRTLIALSRNKKLYDLWERCQGDLKQNE
jgi:hypothetical protein